ncbi:hypothetical protein N7520_002991 [Penicillium odoratum]|uniref:uncharacterized protein n=1 Tax=Penicillium odoratum TaxID=1167516 RepID=UPI002548BFD9|nr:uncharacterized protein N7520_002991 [Penicillium odoratum]KAJ5772462.1 hypothetical protein N7520_002991 [Penicillium odoratum]
MEETYTIGSEAHELVSFRICSPWLFSISKSSPDAMNFERHILRWLGTFIQTVDMEKKRAKTVV